MRNTLFTICAICIARTASANTETVNWFVDKVLYTTTTCESGDDVVLPIAPTKRGHTFSGWTSGIYDMSTINTSVQGTAYEAKSASNTCWYGNTKTSAAAAQENCTNDRYAGLDLRQWRTHFSYGTVYGESMCSDTVGQTMAETGHPVATTSTSKNCWCKVTGIIPTNSDILYDTLVSPWAFLITSSSASVCASRCAKSCGDYAHYTAAFRAGLYG